jgi:Glycosyltransferase family 87
MLTTLVNPTILFLLAVTLLSILSLLAARFGLAAAGVRLQAIQRGLVASRAVLSVLALGAILGIGSRMYLSYLAPGDILQNTISAQEFAHGRSLYPSDLNDLVLAELRDHPPAEPLSSQIPRLKNLQTQQFEVSRLNVVNAHPPLFSLLMVPLVAVCGIYFPAIVVNLALLCLYGYVLYHLLSALFPGLSSFCRTLLMVLGFGWAPVFASIRHASQSLLIGSLVMLCWWLIREGRDGLGGAILGLAVNLKVYPATVFLYLILKRWRAFIAASAATLALAVFAWLCVGGRDIARFAATTKTVVATFGSSRINTSPFAVIIGALDISVSSKAANVVLIVIGAAFVFSAAWILHAGPGSRGAGARNSDLDFAIATCLMCLISPIVWTHYYSVLILPLAVIAKHGVSWTQDGAPKVVFLLLVLVLSLPDPPVLAFSAMLQTGLGRTLSWLLSPRTLAVLSVTIWLAVLKLRPGRADQAAL